jgi:hypothetical protein
MFHDLLHVRSFMRLYRVPSPSLHPSFGHGQLKLAPGNYNINEERVNFGAPANLKRFDKDTLLFAFDATMTSEGDNRYTNDEPPEQRLSKGVSSWCHREAY